MKKTLPLYLGPSVIGSVVCCDEDVRITLSARTYIRISGICRAYVRGRNGSILIGVLSPSDESFAAEKIVSKSLLASHGLSFDEITYAYALKSESDKPRETSGWHPIQEIPELLRRDEAIYSLARTSDALSDDINSPTAIAVPLKTDRPFPRPDVLCLVAPRQINGVLYGVIGITEKGLPRKY